MSRALPENEVVRFFRPEDRKAVRTICCQTGFLGNPVDPVFEDRELFADFLTAYYTDEEPESAVVLEIDGEVKGYILGSRHPGKQSTFDRRKIAGRAVRIFKGLLTRYGKPTREYLFWMATRGWRETPETPQGMAHFHINLLPEFKNVHRTKQMIEFFLAYLAEAGENSVYGQMVTFSNRRGERMFARYGFEVIDSVEITKFRKYTDKKVFLFTVVKDLNKGTGLYGGDLWKSGDPPKK